MTICAAVYDATCRVVELRQYLLRPGMRDVLVELFERELVASQQAAGMIVLGRFADANHPDRFIWLRGFSDMAARRRALAAFYEGPVWARFGGQANATMLDSDDVLLLRPHGHPGQAHAVPLPTSTTTAADRVLIATVVRLDPALSSEFASTFDAHVAPALASDGTQVLAAYQSDPHPNDYQRLPVRDETVFVWFSVEDGETGDAEISDRAQQVRLLVMSTAGVCQVTRLRLIPVGEQSPSQSLDRDLT